MVVPQVRNRLDVRYGRGQASRVNRRLPVRRVWFAEGARALRVHLRERGKEHYLPTDEDWYLCPLCFQWAFTIDALEAKPDPTLTDEHAPPKWADGKELALTCRNCNNESGRTFDGEARKQEVMRRFLAGESSEPMKIRYTLDGVTTNADLHMAGQTGMFIAGAPAPAANNPADVERLMEVMDTYVGDNTRDFNFQIQTRMRVDDNVARVSWIRTAYLVAFAAFGWRYVTQRALDPLRVQFRTFNTITLPVLSMTDRGEIDWSRREIWLIEEPVERRCLMVVCGPHRVFLPILDDPRTLDDLSKDMLGGHEDFSKPATLNVQGKIFPWPKKPAYALDSVPVE